MLSHVNFRWNPLQKNLFFSFQSLKISKFVQNFSFCWRNGFPSVYLILNVKPVFVNKNSAQKLITMEESLNDIYSYMIFSLIRLVKPETISSKCIHHSAYAPFLPHKNWRKCPMKTNVLWIISIWMNTV